MLDEPMAEIAGATEALGVDSAAVLMSKALNPVERASNGQFAAKAAEAPAAVEEDPAKVVDLKTKLPVKAEEQAAPVEDDEDWFELPADEEGKEPRRVKATEVWDAYEQLPKLREELEQAKASAPPPEEYINTIEQATRTRAEYMNGLKMVAQLIEPKDPPIEMLNPASDKYDPDGFYRMKLTADQDRAKIAGLKKHWDSLREQQDAENEALTKARDAREAAALSKNWPEFGKGETVKQTYEVLKAYGYSDQEISKINDHRQFLLLRDAIELRALKAEKAKAVQVVRQKPKIVKGAARTTTDSRASRAASAMENLRSTGSMDAAAAALKALL